MEKSMAKTGFFIGLLNFLHVIIVFMNRDNIILPEGDRTIILFAWFIITVILAVTGFFISKKGYNEEHNKSGIGIAGMALNGVIILPAILVLLAGITSSISSNKKR